MITKNPYASRGKKYVDASRGNTPFTDPSNRAAKRNVRSGSVTRSSTEGRVGANGELNASSKKELIASISALIEDVRTGSIKPLVDRQAERQEWAERTALVKEAMSDRSTGAGSPMQVLGETISDECWETMGRTGFIRKIFTTKPVGQGETARIKIRQKDVVSWMITTDANTPASVIRQPYIYPQDFTLSTHVLIDEKEIAHADASLIDDKYQDALEAQMVREDNLGKVLLDRAAPTQNDVITFNSFTPSVFTALRTQVMRWGIPVPHAIIAYDIWNDIIADTDFSAWFDPVSKHELILEGKIGSLLEVELITDAVRYDTLRVLNPGEVYVLGAPIALGGIVQTADLVAEPINTYNQGKPSRGWFMFQIEALYVGNSRSVSKGLRA